ncbi:MAG: hypothetical protein ACMUJM_14195 [bacterium]
MKLPCLQNSVNFPAQTSSKKRQVSGIPYGKKEGGVINVDPQKVIPLDDAEFGKY